MVTKINSKNTSKLEKEKYRRSINDYRYKELSKHLEKLIDIISIFDSSWKSYKDEYGVFSMELFIKHFDEINSYLDKIYHLLDSDCSKQLQEKYYEILNFEEQYLENIENDNSNSYASKFVVKVLDFNNKLTKIIQEQLIKLFQTICE